MDYLAPERNLPTSNAHLNRQIRVINQWLRLTVGSALALTALAPALRAISLRMAETEHRRQARFVPPPEGPFLPFSTVREALKQTWKQEGYRGFFRGMNALYAMTPIRAAYHLLLFDMVQNESITLLSAGLHPSYSAHNGPSATHQAISEALQIQQHQTPIPPSNSPASPKLDSNSSKRTSRTSFLLKSFGIVLAGELLLYPSRYLFLRMSGDLLGPSKWIETRRTTGLLREVVRKEGILALYRGFFPCLLAISLPALVYANQQFTSRRASTKTLDPTKKTKPSKSVSSAAEVVAQHGLSDWESAKLIVAQDRSNSVSTWDAIVSAKEKYQEDSSVNRAWIWSTIIVYPLICTHVRMAISNESRTPHTNAWRAFPVAKWPRLRAFAAELFPSSSTSQSGSLRWSLRRVMLPGASSVFTAFWAVFAARLLFDGLTTTFADLASWPLNLYQNKTELGIWSAYSLSYNEAKLRLEEILEEERLQTMDSISTAVDPTSGLANQSTAFTDASTSLLYESSSEKTEMNANQLRYHDGDVALQSLGLIPRKLAGDEVYETPSFMQGQMPESLAELDLQSIASERPSQRATLAKTPKSEGEFIRSTGSDAPHQLNSLQQPGEPARTKPKPNAVPLLSQPRTGFS